MRLRATVQLRNDHMLSARIEKGLTQDALASEAGVSVSLISSLERLIFPMSYRYEEALLIADVLGIKPEQVMPERMIGWKGQTKFWSVTDVPLEKLLAYKKHAESHYLLNSPDEAIEKKDDFARVKLLIARLSARQKLVIDLRYGLDQELGGPYTLEEIGERLKLNKSWVGQIERRAIRNLQKMAGNDLVMRHINATSLDKIEDDTSHVDAIPLNKIKYDINLDRPHKSGKEDQSE